MFSDSFRRSKCIAVLLVLLASCVYGYVKGPQHETSMVDVNADPASYQGKVIVRPVRLVISKEGRSIRFRDGPVEAEAVFETEVSVQKIQTGDFVSLKGKTKDHRMLIQDCHIHKHRRLKIVLSVVGLAPVAVYLAIKVRIGRKGFYVRG